MAAGLGELGLRVRGYPPISSSPFGGAGQSTSFLQVSADPRLRYELRPGTHGRAGTTEITINSLGFRDAERTLSKPPGTRRVLVLGDSITFGLDLATEELYPQRVEAALRARGEAIEVLNLGVTGYDTHQEAALLERVGLALEPDLVVVGTCINDLGIQSVELGRLERLERYSGWRSWTRVGLLISMRIDRARLARGAHDLNEEKRFAARYADEIASLDGDERLAERMDALRRQLAARTVPLPRREQLSWYTSPAHVGRLRHSFETLARIAARTGVPVLEVVLPSLHAPPSRPPLTFAYGIVGSEARRVGFDVLRLEKLVDARGPAELRITPEDMIHDNAEGHALIAAAWIAHLEQRAFLGAR